jgi:hypothetical protein
MPHTLPASRKSSMQLPVQQGASAAQAAPVAMQVGSGPLGPGPASVFGVLLQPKAARAAPKVRDVFQLMRMVAPPEGEGYVLAVLRPPSRTRWPRGELDAPGVAHGGSFHVL